MECIDDIKLEKISGGGTTITGTLISAFGEVFKIFFEAGHSVGSSIRRMSNKELCPIK
ncbi:MAG: hypothetical protein J6C28_06425 [Bacilli bacterium]|nr:hypothetical protein [Bacilli bacterium]